MQSRPADAWSSGDDYEPFIGRWSRLVAAEFVRWLDVPAQVRWLDVGCGTGALTQTVLEIASPATVVGVDASADYARYAGSATSDARARFDTADATSLPYDGASFEAVVSGLVVNFVPDPRAAIAEMRRVACPGGVVAAYVWDYPGEMWLLRHFWEAAVALDPAAAPVHEGIRFGFCTETWLGELMRAAGLADVERREIVVPTVFADFDDLWSPFLRGQGPAPSYVAQLSDDRQEALRDRLRVQLPVEVDGRIALTVRAWAARGRR